MTLTLETQDLQRLAQEWAEGSIHKGEPTVEMVNKRNGMVAIVTFVEPEGERISPLDETPALDKDQEATESSSAISE